MAAKDSKELLKMADNHWLYSLGLLRAAGVSHETTALVGYAYRQAMIHGYKHAVEDMSDGKIIFRCEHGYIHKEICPECTP